MKHQSKLFVILGLLFALVAGGCVAPAPSGGAARRQPARRRQPPAGGYVIGVSNTLVGNGWREQMICAIKAEATASGLVDSVVVVNRNGGPTEQIADLEGLISQGVDAIIINPTDREGLNAVIESPSPKGSSSWRSTRRLLPRVLMSSPTTRLPTPNWAPNGCSSNLAALARWLKCAASTASPPTPTATTVSPPRWKSIQISRL